MADRYWIGGTGSVSQTSHWSTSSGGSGGASVPTGSDNVFFDSSSGSGTCTADAAWGADDFLLSTGCAIRLDFSTFGIGSTTSITIQDDTGVAHLMGSSDIVSFDGVTITALVDWETSTLDLEGTGALALSEEANDLYHLHINGYDSARAITFEYVDTSVFNIGGNFTITLGKFDCVDADETDLLNLNIVGDFILANDAGATFTAAPTMNVDIGGDCSIGPAAVFTASTSTFDLTGTGTVKNTSLTKRFWILKLAASGETTTMVGDTNARYLEFGTGVLTADGSGPYYIQTYQSTGHILVNAGVTVNASGGSNPHLRFYYGIGGTGMTLDGINMGSGDMFVEPGTNNYYDILGDWITTGSFRYSAASNGSNFDLNGHNLTCGPVVLSGSGGNTQVLYCGEGTVDCTSFATNALAGVTTLNLESCTFKCSGPFTIGHANHVIVRGTSEIILDGSGAQAIDFLGEQVNNLTLPNIGGTVSFTTAPDIQGTFKPGNGGSTVTIRFPTSGTTHWNAIDTSAASGTGTISMDSISGVASWALTIGSDQIVTSVDVAYSALTGFDIDATDPSNTDSGNNSANWVFVAVTYVDVDGHTVGRGIGRGVGRGVS